MEHGPTPPVAGPDVPVPAVLAIDVESDARAGRPGSGVRALGFERTVAWLEDLRPRLEDAGGRRVRYAWYVRMDPQVTAQAGRADGLVEAAPGAWEAITAAGDVIGLHTHAGRWIEARGRWVEVDSPAGKISALKPPFNLEGMAPRMDAVPAVGEHTRSILAELGYTAAEIELLY